MVLILFCFFNQMSAYDVRISDWSSDVCSSDLGCPPCSVNEALRQNVRTSEIELFALGIFLAWERCQPRQHLLHCSTVKADVIDDAAEYDRVSRSAERKCVESGNSLSVRVDLVIRRKIKKNNKKQNTNNT